MTARRPMRARTPAPCPHGVCATPQRQPGLTGPARGGGAARSAAPGRSRQRARGVSLVEALLALVVMSVGMLAVAGMQATLRGNADLSRQRAEALRIAQASMEAWRGFARVQADPAELDYGDLATQPPQVLTPPGANTTFTTERIVLTSAAPAMKTLSVRVSWTDRAGQTQSLELHSVVSRTGPELAGSLAVPPQGAPVRRPHGRHAAIPWAAVAHGEGTSRFTPPQAGGGTLAWVFDNLSGRIVQTCSNGADSSTCTSTTAMFLGGYLRLGLPPTVPGDPATWSSDVALNPTSTELDLLPVIAGRSLELQARVRYVTETRGEPETVACFIGPMTASPSQVLEYFCALPLFPTGERPWPSWTGRLSFGPTPDLVITASGDLSLQQLRPCRYFDLSGAGNHVGVREPLANQNVLITRAGDGSTAWSCPAGITREQLPT